MSHFGLRKGKEHYKNRAQKKGTIYSPCFAIFCACLGPKIGTSENEVKNRGGGFRVRQKIAIPANTENT